MNEIFSEIIGHQNQKEYLRKILKNQSSAHAFCFSGISKIGKKKIANEFVASILGISLDQVNKHPNIVNIELMIDEKTEKKKKDISVNQIRDLITRLGLSAFDGGKKIAIIDDAHKMNVSAQNALLKTLEEPSGDVLIILIAENDKFLLPTILSRVVHLRFNPVSDDEMKEINSDSELIELSQGRPGILYELQNLENAEDLIRKLVEGRVFLKSSLAERFAMIQKIAKQKDPELIAESINIWRYLIRSAMHKTAGTKIAKHLSGVLKALEKSEISIKQNGNISLSLEYFALSL